MLGYEFHVYFSIGLVQGICLFESLGRL